jgi:7-cyano-7-deazaguanine synthase
MKTLHLVILSGGLDSATALGVADHEAKRPDGDIVAAVSYDYGQKHSIELECAKKLTGHYDCDHKIIPLSTDPFRGGVLTTDQEVPDMSYDDLPDGVMSPTYVPFRNGTLIAMSAAFADSILQSDDNDLDNAILYAGMHAEDGAGFAYADCTPEFLGAMASAVYVGTYGRVRFQAIFEHRTKAQIIHEGFHLRVPYEHTHSCYKGERPACGTCSTCRARLEAFHAINMHDPIDYEVRSIGY